MKKLSLYALIILIAIFSLISSTQAAWSIPSAPPPNGSPDSPVNTGPNAQTKSGDLTLNNLFGTTGLFSNGFGVSGGNFAITTTATSTFAKGIDLSGGCFAINGTCIAGGGGNSLPTGTTNYTLRYDGTAWVASNVLQSSNATLGVGGLPPSTGSALSLPSANASRSSLRITVGVAPTSPVQGDIWNTGNSLFFRKADGTSVDLLAGGGGTNYWTLSSGTLYNNSGTNVGIGTSNISNLAGYSSPIMYLRGGTAAQGSAIYVGNTANDNSLQLGGWGTAGYVGTIGSGPLYLTTNNSTRATIDASGNVGIGTVSPQTKLDVGGPIRTNTVYSCPGSVPTCGATTVGSMIYCEDGSGHGYFLGCARAGGSSYSFNILGGWGI